MFLEVALFEPSKVAKVGRKLGINSDARYRFERGLDKAMVEEGLEYASFNKPDLWGKSVKYFSWNLIFENIKILYEFNFQKIIGIELSQEDQINILNKLSFKVEDVNDDNCLVTVPRGEMIFKNQLILLKR